MNCIDSVSFMMTSGWTFAASYFDNKRQVDYQSFSIQLLISIWFFIFAFQKKKEM